MHGFTRIRLRKKQNIIREIPTGQVRASVANRRHLNYLGEKEVVPIYYVSLYPTVKDQLPKTYLEFPTSKLIFDHVPDKPKYSGHCAGL